MADSKRSQKNRRRAGDQDKKHRTDDQERRERRFLPEMTRMSTASIAIGWLGAAAIGAGVWGRWGPWVSEPTRDFAVYMALAGALAVTASLWWANAGSPVRVGDAGVATERGSEVTRLLWCDIQRISVDGTRLLVQGKDHTISLSFDLHRRPIAWVLREAARRVPEVIDVKQQVVGELPKPNPSDGQVLPVADLQLAGRHCAASGKVIAFERDARLCPDCGQVYHHAHVPTTCKTCQKDLGDRALQVHPS
jgi:hypothetical protein